MSLDVKDAVGVTKTLKTTFNSGEHTPHHQIDGTVTVSGPLTNDQLRALAVPVALDSNSLTALENISVTFPSTQNVSVQNTSLAVTGPLTDTLLRASAVSVTDRGTTGQATVTNFNFTASTAIAASNSARKLLTIFNEGTGLLHVLYGAGTASTSNYSVRLNSGDYLEIEKYTGAVTGIFASSGMARVTEIT